MKPSEMTNEELANELGQPLVGSRIVIEAASRLRLYGENLSVQTACEEQKGLRGEIAELRDCLKEAVGYFCGEDKSDCSEKVYGNPKCEQEEICMVERWRKALERTEDGKADEPRK